MKLLLILLLTFGFLHSNELDDLLNTYTNNSDLSQETKLENGGSSIIFTRKDLDIMQARNLKDLLKSFPAWRYTESRFGNPDIFYKGEIANFNSSNVRVFIDNHEVTSATFGSGFIGVGNMSLAYIDHVEIYAHSPSYEYSTEATYLLIKLYSKVAERDRGAKLRLSYGSLGFNEEILSYAEELEDFSYFTSVYRINDNRKTHYSYDVPLNRDKENSGFFASLYSENHKLQLITAKGDAGTSIGASPSATYDISTSYYEYIKVGYDTSYMDNLTFSISYQDVNLGGHRRETAGLYDDPWSSPEVEAERSENVLTSELKYNLESETSRFIFGAKFRHKSFKTNSLKLNGIDWETSDYDRQNILSVFAEERYNLSAQNIINLAVQYSDVDNNSNIDDANLWQFRLSHTYLVNNFIFKSFAYHIESLVEPYLYNDFKTEGSLKPQILNAINEEIKYRHDKGEFKLMLTYNSIDDFFMQTRSGGFINSPVTFTIISTYMEFTHNFDIDNKIIANISYNHAEGFQNLTKESAAFIRSLNRINKFDIFNELIFNRNNNTDKNYFDYSAGVKYRYNRDLTLSIKGENIFNTGYEESYFRIDPNTGTQELPLLISPIEQRFYVTVEYQF